MGMPATIRLPPLQIKPFTGDLTDWPEFKATCENTFSVITDESHRFRNLKGYQSGEPANMIKHLPLNHGSYDKAYDMLKNRYDNHRAIINANLKRLFELPVLTNGSAAGLKQMLNTANECIATNNTYTNNTDSWSCMMIFILSQRLDATSIKQWEEAIQGQRTIPEYSVFLKFLETRINILETTVTSSKIR